MRRDAWAAHIAHAYSDVASPCWLCARGPGVRQVRAWGHAANVHCHATRIVRVGVHCAFTRLALARAGLTREGRVNEIPRAHALTFRGCGVFLRVIQLSHVGKILWMLAFHRELCNVKCTLSFVEFQNVCPFRFLLYAQSRPKVVLIVVKAVDMQA